MLSSRVRILNFDNSLTQQAQLLKRFTPSVIDLTQIAPSCRLWLGCKEIDKIRKLLDSGHKNEVTFLGSGDFHHISRLLIEQFSNPISVIVFDFHPDWDILPPRLGCGSWISSMLENNSNIEKVILLGVSSEDISNFKIETGGLKFLENNRLEIYPYVHKPSRVFSKKVPKNISLKAEKSLWGKKIYWSELKGKNLADFALSLASRLKGKHVYISIDKDCLQQDYALTNWEEGLFSLEELLMILKVMKENLDIVGVDITGDYSHPVYNCSLKAFFSRLDHPRIIAAEQLVASVVNSVNEATNIRILETLIS